MHAASSLQAVSRCFGTGEGGEYILLRFLLLEAEAKAGVTDD